MDKQLYVPSILNRLIDLDPLNNEPGGQQFCSFREVEKMVLSDLEHLLNTRQPIIAIPDSCPEARKSLLRYGIGDFTAQNPQSVHVRRKLCQNVAATIAVFEPRLTNVVVRLAQESTFHGLHFKITATLEAEPFKEPVFFDTFMDTGKGEFLIKS